MKSLLPAGAGIGLSLLLSSTSIHAREMPNLEQRKPQNQVSLQSEFTYLKSNIKYLAKSLSVAGTKAEDKKPSVAPLQVPKSQPAVDIRQLFPVNTPYLFFVSTQSEKWQGFERFHLYSMAEKAIAQFAPQQIEFDYKRDVESWLGKQVVFGLLPKQGNTLASIESSYIAVFPIRDQNRTDLLLGSLGANPKRVKTREYKGVTIYEITTPKLIDSESKPRLPQPGNKALPEENLTKILGAQSRTIAIASLPGHVAMGLSGKAVEQIVDSYQDNSSHLGQNQDFQEFWQQSQTDEILMSAYQNPVETVKLYQDILKTTEMSLEETGLGNVQIPQFVRDFLNPEQYEKYRYTQGMLKLQPEGLRMQAAYRYHPQQNKQLKDKPIPMVGRMPGATYSTFTSSNLSLQWQAFTKILGSVKEFEQGLTGMREFIRNSTGLDFDKEIIGWIDGNYGLFSFPTKGGFLNQFNPNFNLGMGFIAETTQPEVAKKTINKLEEVATLFSGGALKVNNTNIKGTPVTSWEIEGNQSMFAYSWLNDNSIVLSTGLGAIAELVPTPRSPLNTAYNFTTATNTLPKPNQGYFYVNMGSSLSWVYGLIPQQFQTNPYFRTFKEAIGSVYSISSTSSQIENGSQFDMLVVLAPNREKSPKLVQK